MDFSDTPEEAKFRKEARGWIEANAPKHLAPHLEKGLFGNTNVGPDHDPMVEAKKWQKKKYDAGWAVPAWPKEYGGRGATPIERVIWNEEEGVYGRLSSPYVISFGMCGPTMMAYATEEQKRRYLNKMASGEEIWCQLFSEPAAGSDLAGLRTRAEKKGDEWIVNGQKIWTSGAHYSDYAILITRTDPTLEKHKGLTMFFVSMKSPGIEVRPIKQVNGDSHFNEVFFTDLRIPDSQRLGKVNDGWNVSLTTLMNERLSIGSGMPTGFEDIFEYLLTLEGPDGAAIDDKAVRSKLAEWWVRSSGLKYTSMRMISALSRGQTPGPEASIGKVVAGSTLQEVSQLAMDLQGLSGALAPGEIDPKADAFYAMFLRSPATRIEGGTDEILRNIIAERVLGLPPDMRADKGLPFNKIPTGS